MTAPSPGAGHNAARLFRMMLFLGATPIASCLSATYVPYLPVERAPTGELTTATASISDAEREALEQVLRYYGVDHKRDADGTLLIPRALARDPDLLANYTTKSRDPAWLQTHTPTEP